MYNVFDEANFEFGLPIKNVAEDSSNDTIEASRNNITDNKYTTIGNGPKFIFTEKPVNNADVGEIPYEKIDGADEIIKHDGNCERPKINIDVNNTIIKEIPLNATNEIFKPDELDNNIQLLNDTINNINDSVRAVLNGNEITIEINENEYNNETVTVISQITDINNASGISGDYRENPETVYFLDNGFKEQKPLFTPVIFNYTNMRKITETNDDQSKRGTLPSFNILLPPSPCTENDEPPSNIGPCAVPAQKDIFHIRDHLLAMYNGFHAKAMHFLKDIKEATQASWARKMLCRTPRDLMTYRRCVRWAGNVSMLTTKSLVSALEAVRLDVASLTEERACNISSMSIDPIHLIRILAAEKVSLEFALPDFLRQLHACARHCPSPNGGTLQNEYLETARLTDKDFVLRHYFTQQNYNKQLKQKYKI